MGIKKGFKESDRVFISYDEIVGTFKVFAFPCNEKNCYVCKHCTDVIIGWDGIPYASSCEYEEDLEDCNRFEWDEFMTTGEWANMNEEEKSLFIKQHFEKRSD